MKPKALNSEVQLAAVPTPAQQLIKNWMEKRCGSETVLEAKIHEHDKREKVKTVHIQAKQNSSIPKQLLSDLQSAGIWQATGAIDHAFGNLANGPGINNRRKHIARKR